MPCALIERTGCGGAAVTPALRLLPDIAPEIAAPAPTVDATDDRTGRRRVAGTVKTVFDVLAATVLLIVLAPVLLLVAAAVRLSSRGPALFRQTRVGRRGRTFTIVKFRTMVGDAERRRKDLLDLNEVAGGVLFKLRHDPRVTPLGRILRRLSIDELPQLLNVIGGSMSLVGPRPPLPAEVARYEAHARRRLLVKPGITGLWQVSGRSDLSWDDALRLDLHYVDEWSLRLDAVVLARTFRAVYKADGAY